MKIGITKLSREVMSVLVEVDGRRRRGVCCVVVVVGGGGGVGGW